MDDEVERLERLHAQDPNDGAIAARLKAALLRAGRRDDLARRYKLAFACPQDWDAMPESSPGVRHCASCNKAVHFAQSYADFDRLAAKGHCLAVRPQRLPQVIDGLIDAPQRGLLRAKTDPCLVEGKDRGQPRPPSGGMLTIGRVSPDYVPARLRTPPP